MIYFIRPAMSSLVKIGHTRGSVTERLNSLQTGSPDRLILLGITDGDKKTEQWLHWKFDVDRVKGEWFRMSPTLAKIIATCRLSFRMLTWDVPSLIDLAGKAGRIEWGPAFCASAVWYGPLSPDAPTLAELATLVGPTVGGGGWVGSDGALYTAQAAIFGLLPTCHAGCGCPEPKTS